LAFYCPPDRTRQLIAELAHDDAGRVAFLTEVQQLALARYGTDALRGRFYQTGILSEKITVTTSPKDLSEQAKSWRQTILNRVEP
jgi:hypothetical protein